MLKGQRKKGQILVIVIIFMAAILTLGMALIQQTSSNIKQSRALAENAGERSLGPLITDLTYLYLSDTYTETINGALANARTINEEGEVSYRTAPFDTAMASFYPAWLSPSNYPQALASILTSQTGKDYTFTASREPSQSILIIQASSPEDLLIQTMTFQINPVHIEEAVEEGHHDRLEGNEPLIELIDLDGL